MKHKWINGTKGFISLLVLVTMLPFYSLAAMLEESGRYQASSRTLTEAAGISANSVLSDYDSYLLSRFGLLAVSQGDAADTDSMNSKLTTTFNTYISSQHIQGVKSFRNLDGDTTKVNGVYPLGDINILQQQIFSYSSVRVPVKGAEDLAKLSELANAITSQLKIDGILNVIDGIGKLADAGKDLRDKNKDLETKINALKKEVGKDESLNAWSDAVDALQDFEEKKAEADEQAEEEEDTSDNQDTSGQSGKEQELKDAVENAKDDYISHIDAVILNLQYENDAAQECKKASDSVADKAVSFGTKGVGAVLDATKEKKNNEVKKSNMSEERKAAEKDKNDTTYKNLKTLGSGVEKSTDDFVTKENQKLDLFLSKKIQDKCDELKDIKDIVKNYDLDKDPGDDVKFNCDDFTNSSDIKTLIEDQEENSLSDYAIEYLKSIFSCLSEFFTLDLMYNPELSVMIDDSFFNQLPTQNQNIQTESTNPFEADDKKLAEKHLNTYMDYPVLKDNRLSLGSNDVINCILALRDASKNLFASNLDSNGTYNGKINALKKALEGTKKVVNAINDLFQAFNSLNFQVLQNIQNSNTVSQMSESDKQLYAREIMMGYLCQTLANRSNYSDFTSKGGLSSTSFDEHTANSFSGCELEYVAFGNQNERENQKMMFCMIWCLRIIIDMFSLLTNHEFYTCCDAFAGIPFIGPVVAFLYMVACTVGEPFVDTIFLGNGQSLPIYKKNIYFTPSGLPDLAEKITEVTILGENKLSNFSENLAKAARKAAKDGEKVKEKAKSEESDAFSMGKALDDYKKKILEFNYTQHAFIVMSFLGDTDSYLKHLQDIITMEEYQYHHGAGIKSQQIYSGTADNFSISRAYTCLRIQLSGNFTPVLLPTLSDRSVNYGFSPLTYSKVLYRGY